MNKKQRSVIVLVIGIVALASFGWWAKYISTPEPPVPRTSVDDRVSDQDREDFLKASKRFMNKKL